MHIVNTKKNIGIHNNNNSLNIIIVLCTLFRLGQINKQRMGEEERIKKTLNKKIGYLEACYHSAGRTTTSRMASTESRRTTLRQARNKFNHRPHARKRTSTADSRYVGVDLRQAFLSEASTRVPWPSLICLVVG